MNHKQTLIIAEAGVNHNGNIEIAKKLCLKAKEAGADVIKFQTWITEKIITRNVKQAEYQIQNTGVSQSQFDMLKQLELSFEQFVNIKKYCDDIGITFASTADETESLDFLIDLGIPFIKIGSGDVGNIPYLRYVGSKNLPVLLSTGMSTLGEIELSLKALKEKGAKDITLLHCTTSYPCPFQSVNLNAMTTLAKAFGTEVGYSDHTKGIEIPIAAVAQGARIIEKHFTLDKNMEGPDHLASCEPTEFKSMVDAIRNVEVALGNGNKEIADIEKEIVKVVKKRIVANKDIKMGDIISEEDVCIKRSENGVACDYWDLIIGTRARKDFAIDEGITI